MTFLNCRRNVLYTREAPRDTIALVLCAFLLFASNNKPFKCYRLKGYRSVIMAGKQVTSVFNTPETFPKPQ